MSEVVEHTQCPDCADRGEDRAGDNLALYEDGGTFCFKCKAYTYGGNYMEPKEDIRYAYAKAGGEAVGKLVQAEDSNVLKAMEKVDFVSAEYAPLEARGFSCFTRSITS